MESLVFKFKGFIGLVIILLLTQQSFADFMPMNCDDTKDHHTAMETHSTQVSPQMNMNMHDHDSQSKVSMGSNVECDVCDSSDCRCSEFTRCLSSSVSITAQAMNLDYALFVSHGKRFISSDEYPDPGNYLHPFRPPISI